MHIYILLLVITSSVFGAPQAGHHASIGADMKDLEDTQSQSVVVNNDVSYGHAADLHYYYSNPAASIPCLKSAGVQALFFVGLRYDNQSFNNGIVANIREAYNARLGVEVYLEANPNKDGTHQLDTMIYGLTNNGIYVRSVWIKVTNKIYSWPTDTYGNTVFINSILTRARQIGLTVGIFTNSNDWSRITANWAGAGSDVLLWYYSNSGDGSSKASPANFNDFVAFGGFKTPSIKQYSSLIQQCNVASDQNVYPIGISAKKLSFVAPEGKIVVGGIGL